MNKHKEKAAIFKATFLGSMRLLFHEIFRILLQLLSRKTEDFKFQI